MEACGVHGLPQKIRSDLSGENVKVWRYIVEQHTSNSAVITGSSTHNERIERLWRDVMRCVMRCVIGVYYDTFKSLEEEGKLDPLNEVDLFCLHRVYMPRINAQLKSLGVVKKYSGCGLLPHWENIATPPNIKDFYKDMFISQRVGHTASPLNTL